MRVSHHLRVALSGELLDVCTRGENLLATVDDHRPHRVVIGQLSGRRP
jgi:hypothetical protein